MPADRTLVTELATALGTLQYPDLRTVVLTRPEVLRIGEGTWDRLEGLFELGGYAMEFGVAYDNGRAFAVAPDGLAGRPPRIIEWTGGRRPAGDEVAPIDLRIDHVYLISCKYLSDNIGNPSPARLFEGLLATNGSWERGDWFQVVAPDEYQALYRACRSAAKLEDLPDDAAAMTSTDRDRLRRALGERQFPVPARQAYRNLCAAVSRRSAQRWTDRLAGADPERVLCRLLRIGNAPYFLLGAHGSSSLRLRVGTAWDWHYAYRLRQLAVTPTCVGQPRVDWIAFYSERGGKEVYRVNGHVEVRWSHGRFSQPPEAKIYLDTPITHVPGYFGLEGSGSWAPAVAQGRLPGTYS